MLRRHPALVATAIGTNLVQAIRLATDLSKNRARDLEKNRVNARIRARARHLARALNLARNLARDLVLTRDLDLDPARSFARDLDLELAQARNLGLVLDRALDIALALDHDLGLPAARVLGLDPAAGQGLGTLLAEGGLDDFTTADLSNAELLGVQLDGVYWSMWGTRWPPSLNIEWLKARSREVDQGSGIYIVEYPSTSDLPTSV